MALSALVAPLKRRFDQLFARTYSERANASFLAEVQRAWTGGAWSRLLALFRKALTLVAGTSPSQGRTEGDEAPRKRARRELSESVAGEWAQWGQEVQRWGATQEGQSSGEGRAFAFVPGALVQAVQQGEWLLLDEINMAPDETLQALAGLLDGKALLLAERGDLTPLLPHPSFTLFAAMNPPGDAGKRALQPSIRERFTELRVPEAGGEELVRLVLAYLAPLRLSQAPSLAQAMTAFYAQALEASRTSLQDGTGQRPRYSLRTLTRALTYAVGLLQRPGVTATPLPE